jgi:PAS domain S-box-containing protein
MAKGVRRLPRKSNNSDRKKMRMEPEDRGPPGPAAAPRNEPSSNLEHELLVHQVELEVQNEELRRSQVALEEARDLYSEVFQFAPVGYLILSDAGLIQDANLAVATLFGVERSKLLERPFTAFLGREEADRWHLLFPTLIRRGEWLSFRLALRRNDGLTLHTRFACEGQRTRDGKSVVRVVVSDISEQVHAERALQDTKDRLSEVLDEFQDGYWDWFVEGKKIILSRRLRTMLGLTDEGHETPLSYDPAWNARIHAEDRPLAKKTMANLVEGRLDAIEVECRWKVSEAEWKWLRARGRIAKRDGSGRAVRIKGTVTDITELKRLQESFRRHHIR